MYKKILGIVFVLIFGFLITVKSSQVYAAACGVPVKGVGITIPAYPIINSHTIIANLSSGFVSSHGYILLSKDTNTYSSANSKASSPLFFIDKDYNSSCKGGKNCVSVKDKVVTWIIDSPEALSYDTGSGKTDSYFVDLDFIGSSTGISQCDIGTYEVERDNAPGSCEDIRVFQNRNGESCYQNQSRSACFATNIPITVKVTGLKSSSGEPWNGDVGLRVTQDGFWTGEWDGPNRPATNGEATISFTPNISNSSSEFHMYIEDRKGLNEDFPKCDTKLTISNACNENQCEKETIINFGRSSGPDIFSLCKQIPEHQTAQINECYECTGGTPENEGSAGIWTAIGCISKEPQAIIQSFISVGLGIGGGVALLTFLAAGFIYSTSQGNPEKVKGAKEMMTASIVGILFIIFSVTLLQFIGWSVLKIPGFGG